MYLFNVDESQKVWLFKEFLTKFFAKHYRKIL
ncbi:hypothetical protein SAMN05216339_10642 [Nitrosomonas eutropha]|uniref:Uncharacterized protein n=1 Tax=Nitrosomonas eutropha TaxID=916 RepID=A0A1I7HVI5_9PROT|nr:hypothetical protein SAMN05216339_10642 [Nitrosomonas eutropha]